MSQAVSRCCCLDPGFGKHPLSKMDCGVARIRSRPAALGALCESDDRHPVGPGEQRRRALGRGVSKQDRVGLQSGGGLGRVCVSSASGGEHEKWQRSGRLHQLVGVCRIVEDTFLAVVDQGSNVR